MTFLNVPVVYIARGGNDFNAGNIRYEGHWKGVGPEIETSLVAISGPIVFGFREWLE